MTYFKLSFIPNSNELINIKRFNINLPNLETLYSHTTIIMCSVNIMPITRKWEMYRCSSRSISSIKNRDRFIDYWSLVYFCGLSLYNNIGCLVNQLV